MNNRPLWFVFRDVITKESIMVGLPTAELESGYNFVKFQTYIPKSSNDREIGPSLTLRALDILSKTWEVADSNQEFAVYTLSHIAYRLAKEFVSVQVAKALAQ